MHINILWLEAEVVWLPKFPATSKLLFSPKTSPCTKEVNHYMHIQKSNVFVRTFNFHTTVGEPIGKIMNFILKTSFAKAIWPKRFPQCSLKSHFKHFKSMKEEINEDENRRKKIFTRKGYTSFFPQIYPYFKPLYHWLTNA